MGSEHPFGSPTAIATLTETAFFPWFSNCIPVPIRVVVTSAQALPVQVGAWATPTRGQFISNPAPTKSTAASLFT